MSVLNIEYGRLRHVLLTHLLNVASTPQVREDLIRLDDGLDRAIQHAVHRYTDRRDALRDRFIGVLGHDLRAPLAAASFARMVLASSEALALKQRNALETIERSIDRMTRMVNDLLDFARGQLGGGIPASPVECDMGALCRTVAEELRNVHPERSIAVHCQGDLKGTFDPDRVAQCIGNVLGNALQHGEDPIAISVSESEDRRAVVTRVANRGKPIAPELLRKCFEPFAGATREARSGLGLGLYIVGEIARAHGAICDVASTADETVVTIRWPRTPRNETPGRP